MDVVYTHWCGLDVHKRDVVACLVTPGSAGPVQKTIRRFSTMTGRLEALARQAVERQRLEAIGPLRPQA